MDALIRCHVCGDDSGAPFIREGGWHYYRCRGCGLVFLHPQPSEAFLAEHYQHYLPVGEPERAAWQRLMQPVTAWSVALLKERYARPGRLLDVGCGHGFFLKAMAERGWQVEGIEISASGRDYARHVLGLKVSAQALPRADLADGQFDVITLFYVIEHLANPRAVLAEVRRLLRPGGLVLLRWPHTAPLVRMLKPWVESLRLYQAPSHLFDFAPRSITILLTELGFQRIRTTIGGWTRPENRVARLAAAVFGRIAAGLDELTEGRWLLPGVSKTTLAVRGSSA
jgi:SAM-dependent methyltransferase